MLMNHYCDKCGLIFDTPEQLGHHRAAFCTNGQMPLRQLSPKGQTHAIDLAMEELKHYANQNTNIYNYPSLARGSNAQQQQENRNKNRPSSIQQAGQRIMGIPSPSRNVNHAGSQSHQNLNSQPDPNLLNRLTQLENQIRLSQLKQDQVSLSQISLQLPGGPDPGRTAVQNLNSGYDDLAMHEQNITSLTQQEYETLKTLTNLPPQSDLYLQKNAEYQSISQKRQQAQVQLMQLKNFRNVLTYNPQEELVKKQQKDYLERHQRSILNNQQQQQQFGYINGQQNNSNLAKADTAFVVFDSIVQSPDNITDVEVCFSLQKDGNLVSYPKPQTFRHKSKRTDFENTDRVRFLLDYPNLFRGVQPQMNLIVEVRTPEVGGGPSGQLQSTAWTVMPLFNPANELNLGRWRLPFYQCPTFLGIDLLDICNQVHHSDMQLCLRIGSPTDQSLTDFRPDQASRQYYNLAPYHSELQPSILNNAQHISQHPSQKPPSNMNLHVPQPTKPTTPLVIPPSEKRDPDYSCPGLKLMIHYLKQPDNVSNLQVQAIIYHGPEIVEIDPDSFDDEQCRWSTAIVNGKTAQEVQTDSKVQVGKKGIFIDNPPSKQGAQEPIPVYLYPTGEDKVFEKDFYELVWDDNLQKNLVLLITVYRHSQRNDKTEIVSFLAKKLTHEDGKLVHGTFEEFLYKPTKKQPNPTVNLSTFDKIVKAGKLEQGLIQFTLQHPDYDHEQTMDGLFIPNPVPQYDLRKHVWDDNDNYNDKKTLDIVIEQVLNLPDNVSLVQIIAAVRDGANHLIPSMPRDKNGNYKQYHYKFPVQRLSTVQNQVYNFEVKIRQQEIDPTATLQLKFVTYDFQLGDERLVGETVFPLFINPSNSEPFEASSHQKYDLEKVLHHGAYRLPIYCDERGRDKQIDKINTFSYKDYLQFERIPTSSVLIRVHKAGDVPRDEDLPDYRYGDYSTTYYLTSQNERDLIQIRNKRKIDKALQPTMSRLLEKTLKLGNGAIESDKDVQRQFERLIIGKPDYNILNLNFFSVYNYDKGFRFNLEAVEGLQLKNQILSALISVVPPGSAYASKKRGGPDFEAVFTKVIPDLYSSSSGLITFDSEGDWFVQNVALCHSAVLLIDLKLFDLQSQQYSDFGFSIYPLTRMFNNFIYLQSNVRKLEIYEGAPPASLVKLLNEKPTEFSQDLVEDWQEENGDLPKFNHDIRAIVKVVDNQREAHFLHSWQNYCQILPSSKARISPDKIRDLIEDNFEGNLDSAEPLIFQKFQEFVKKGPSR